MVGGPRVARAAPGYGPGMDDEADLPPTADPEEEEGLLDRLRDMPVGTLDPNIIGDAGPTDIPPGSDPPLEDDDAIDPGPDPAG